MRLGLGGEELSLWFDGAWERRGRARGKWGEGGGGGAVYVNTVHKTSVPPPSTTITNLPANYQTTDPKFPYELCKDKSWLASVYI